MRFRLACWLLCAVFSACEPEATPFPVDIPTPATATPAVDASTPLRYAIAPNAAGSISDLNQLESSAQITLLSEAASINDLGNRFDIIATYGLYPDSTPSPVAVNLALWINTALPPLNNPAPVNIIRRSLDTTALASAVAIPGVQAAAHDSASLTVLRAELANAGWPDGIDLSLAHELIVGADALQTQLQRLNIHLNLFPLQESLGRTHLALVTWSTTEQRTVWTEQNGGVLIDLLTLPISYWAVPGLQISYSPHGWPVASRP